MINAYILYKISNKLFNWGVPLLPKIVKGLIFLIYNSSIPYQCIIGSGSTFAYGGIAVVLHKRTVIGKKCIIGTNVTIGGKSNHYDVPSIGNNVKISAGAKILGPVTIGNNVTIGANAVVINDFPDNCVIAGIPAKIIKRISEL
jgi:serine O-acetyltransferase